MRRKEEKISSVLDFDSFIIEHWWVLFDIIYVEFQTPACWITWWITTTSTCIHTHYPLIVHSPKSKQVVKSLRKLKKEVSCVMSVTVCVCVLLYFFLYLIVSLLYFSSFFPGHRKYFGFYRSLFNFSIEIAKKFTRNLIFVDVDMNA